MFTIRLAFIAIISIFLVACNNISSDNSSNNDPSHYMIGSLPNGDTVFASSSNFTVNTTTDLTTGTLSVVAGKKHSSQTYTVTLNITPTTSSQNITGSSDPIVTTNPNPCIISDTTNSCQIVFNSLNANSGNYVVTVSYTDGTNTAQLPHQMNLTITHSVIPTPTPEPTVVPTVIPTPNVNSGNLVIMPLSTESLVIGNTITAIISLTDSENVTIPVDVNVFSNNPSILSIENSYCALTTANNACFISLNANAIGTTHITARATNYRDANSTNINVISDKIPGLLVINDVKNSLTIGDSMIANVKLINSQGITTPIAVNIMNNNTSLINLQNESCFLTSTNNSCDIHIHGQNSGTATFSISATDYDSVTSPSITVYESVNATMLTPFNNQKSVGIGTPIILKLSESIDPTSVINGIQLETASNNTDIAIESFNYSQESKELTLIYSLSKKYFNYNTQYHLTINGLKDSHGNNVAKLNTSFTTQESYLIFITQNAYNGDLKTHGNGSNGVEGADNLCNQDAGCPASKTCKAMIAATGLRSAEPNMLDWVLESYTAYKNTANDLIAVTGITNNGIPVDITMTSQTREFFFSVANPVTTQFHGSNGAAWTGMYASANWMTSTNKFCGEWDNATNSMQGTLGSADVRAQQMLYNGSVGCVTARKLYCVEQR